MKKIFSRSLAAALCAGMALSLAACSSTAASSQSAASSEAAGSEASSAASAPVDPDPLAQKAADFNYSAALDELHMRIFREVAEKGGNEKCLI